MTQEDKQLLLVDLCSRLSYGVKFRTLGGEFPFTLKWIDDIYRLNGDVKLENAKVFLRPMSSMTQEEKVEYCDLQDKFLLSSQYPVTDGYTLFDWLNAHHFDYRGLIKKGLAIAATKDNNKD